MRAILDRNLKIGQEFIELTLEQAHHFNVVRTKVGEQVLVLDGLGHRAVGEVCALTKKSGIIKIISVQEEVEKHNISLAIACPKKDAFEEIIKIAVELGVRKIYPLQSQFSQYQYSNSERLDKIIESAMVQSNNLFFPIVENQKVLQSFLDQMSTPIVYFCSHNISLKTFSKLPTDEIIVLIGPEAGFSKEEEEQIAKYKNINQIHLPTPILRAPTAVATSVGYLISKA